MFKRILVAVDGSPPSTKGLKIALDLAKDQTAELFVVHVVPTLALAQNLSGAGYGPADSFESLLDGMRDAGRRVLAKAAAAAAKVNCPVHTVLAEGTNGSVAQHVLAQAGKLHADVIVLGTHGRRGLGRLVMGSDAEGVLREARVPVLLVRAGATPARAVVSAGAKRRGGNRVDRAIANVPATPMV